MFTVYLSHSVSPVELAQVYVLAEEAERQGLRPVVASRLWNPTGDIPSDVADSVRAADAILCIATASGHYYEAVNLELQVAGQAPPRPILALVEVGVETQGFPPDQLVRFDRWVGITEALDEITAILKQMAVDKANRDLLAKVAVGGLMLLALSALGGDSGKGSK